MVKRLFVLASLVWLVSIAGTPLGAREPMAEVGEFCRETAEYWYGQYLECRASVCVSGVSCNNDSNQCICRLIE
jgi:hypothetical protein